MISLSDELLARARRFSSTFVETGTFRGECVVKALDAGFEKVLTCEINPVFIEDAKKTIGECWLDRVEIFEGDSAQMLPVMLGSIKGPAVVYLDAHDTIPAKPEAAAFVHKAGWEHSPLRQELAALKAHGGPLFIIIDDVELCGGARLDFISLLEIHQRLMEIDASLGFEIVKSKNGISDLLIAAPAHEA